MKMLKTLMNGDMKFVLPFGQWECTSASCSPDVEIRLTRQDVEKLAVRAGLIDPPQ